MPQLVSGCWWNSSFNKISHRAVSSDREMGARRREAAEHQTVKGKRRRQMATLVLSSLSKQALMVGTSSILKNTLASQCGQAAKKQFEAVGSVDVALESVGSNSGTLLTCDLGQVPEHLGF